MQLMQQDFPSGKGVNAVYTPVLELKVVIELAAHVFLCSWAGAMTDFTLKGIIC